MKKLTNMQKAILLEALRRYTKFHQNPKELLNQAWTGLGTRTDYRPVLDAGLMTFVEEPYPRCSQWLRLTDKGTAIVQKWLDAGLSYKDIEVSRRNEPTCFGFVALCVLTWDEVKEA